MVDCLRYSIPPLVVGLETGEQCQKRQGSMWAKITRIWDIRKSRRGVWVSTHTWSSIFPFLVGMGKHVFNCDFLLI